MKGMMVGSTLALILMSAHVGQAGDDPQRAYERNLGQERTWQQQHEEHLERQERQREEQFRWQTEERERRNRSASDAETSDEDGGADE